MDSWGYRDLDPWLRSGRTERGTGAGELSWKRWKRRVSRSYCEVFHLVSTVA